MSEPVAYFVAERRDGQWLFGDEWSPEFPTLAEARAEAHSWRNHVPTEDIGVFAVVQVEAGAR